MHFTNRFARNDFTSVNTLVWTHMRSCSNLIHISWTVFKRIKLVNVSCINYSLFDDLSLKCFHRTTVIAQYSTGSNHRKHFIFFLPPTEIREGNVFGRLCLSFCLPCPHSTGTPTMFKHVQFGPQHTRTLRPRSPNTSPKLDREGWGTSLNTPRIRKWVMTEVVLTTSIRKRVKQRIVHLYSPLLRLDISHQD